MLMNAQLLSHVSDGPFWDYVDTSWGENCRKYWWTNLLFVNNFHPSNLNNECVAQSWYLANGEIGASTAAEATVVAVQFFVFTFVGSRHAILRFHDAAAFCLRILGAATH